MKSNYFAAAAAGFKSGITVSSANHWRPFSVAISPHKLLKTVEMLFIFSTGSNITVIRAYYNRALPDGGAGMICELTALLSLIDGWVPVGPLEILAGRPLCTD